MHETQSVPDDLAYRKAHLIQDALRTLQAAHHLDERDDLDAASFLEWYDRTIPDVRDIKILAGAMEIELARRRGEQIIQEGELRGGETKLSPGDSLLSNATMVQRSKDRALAAAPEAVQAFVQRKVKAGQGAHSARRGRGAARIARARATPGIQATKPPGWPARRPRRIRSLPR